VRTRYIVEWEEYDGCATDKGTTCDNLDELSSVLDLLMSQLSKPSTIHAYEIKDGQVVEMMQWLVTSPYVLGGYLQNDKQLAVAYMRQQNWDAELFKRIADGMDWTIVKGDELEALKKEALGE
jgi:hypothetical protein